MHTENKKELALEIIRRLKQAYPDAACSLDYTEAWKLLVSVRLAGFPNTSPIIRLALLRPTPGNFKSASKSSGTLPS